MAKNKITAITKRIELRKCYLHVMRGIHLMRLKSPHESRGHHLQLGLVQPKETLDRKTHQPRLSKSRQKAGTKVSFGFSLLAVGLMYFPFLSRRRLQIRATTSRKLYQGSGILYTLRCSDVCQPPISFVVENKSQFFSGYRGLEWPTDRDDVEAH